MRPSKLLAPIAILMTLALLPFGVTLASDEQPNVLLIITDEHNFRTLGCYRDLMSREQAEMWGPGVVVETPYIDSLAKDGVICSRGYATTPSCTPCRAAMFTGRYPHWTGAPKHNTTLNSKIPTIANRLGDAGYRTGFFGKWHLGGEGKPGWAPEVDGGFQFKKFMFNRGHWKKFAMENGKPVVGAKQNGEPSYGVAGADEASFATDWLTDRALDYMTDKEQTKPFFTVLSLPDPHGPNSVRAPYDHRFDKLKFTAPRTFNLGGKIKTPRWAGVKVKHAEFREVDMSKYFGMVKCIDDNMGKLIARLKETGQLDNTLLIFTSDHGDMCYEHDRINKGNPYEGSARVPMIFRFPEKLAKSHFAEPVGTVDLTPTILGFLGLPGSKSDQGRDLSTELAKASKQKSDDAESTVTFVRGAGMKAGWVAAIDSRYKLILSQNDDPWLLDIERDPDELVNLYKRKGNEKAVARLAKAMDGYKNSFKDPSFEQPNIAKSLTEVLEAKSEASPEKKTGSRRPTPGVANVSNTNSSSDKGTRQPNFDSKFQSNWKGTRQWIGPDWWANPMMDWSLQEGAVIAPALENRTLCLLTADLGTSGSFDATVQIEGLGEAEAFDTESKAAAGFRIGRRGGIADYRHALVHATDWIDATIGADGRLRLGDSVSEESLALDSGPVSLTLSGRSENESGAITMTATRDGKTIRVEKTFSGAKIAGGVSLLSTGAPRKDQRNARKVKFAFRNFRLGGELVNQHSDRSFGPILWSQYTLNQNQLRLQAQFAPLDTNTGFETELWTADEDDNPTWAKVATKPIEKLSRTAAFTIDHWESTKSKLYQIRFTWHGKDYAWDGRVRREPTIDEPFKLGCFSCDHGYLFPIPEMVEQVKKQDPDMVYFAGDQIYESYGGFGTIRTDDTQKAMLDYLRKFYQFGWTWRDVLRDRPSVILPDDHDVFQGNIWGHGGRKLPAGEKKNNWLLGGYIMPGDWVNAVEKTNVGHLPDPVVDMELPIGIKPYFTSMVYGGIGFAILEDRKFKTGPLSMPEKTRRDGVGASLLGEQQEAFIKEWGEDWSGQKMKCALSQTIFCTAATHTGHELKRTRNIFDSGGWPKAARDRAVRLLGDCNAFCVHGDQHLGVLLRQGVDDFDDASYAFMVPGTANGFPRAWWPGFAKQGQPEPSQTFTGKFRDDGGHPIHVLGVGNPEPGSNRLPKSEDPMVIGYRKGSGYGMVEFNRKHFTAKVSLYRLGNKGEMFGGFPQTLNIGGKPKNE